MKKKENPENSRKRNKLYYQRMKQKGLKLIKIWVPEEYAESIKKVVKNTIINCDKVFLNHPTKEKSSIKDKNPKTHNVLASVKKPYKKNL